MSETIMPHKQPNKAKGLGRGLGSLLGPTNEGAFAKTTGAHFIEAEAKETPEIMGQGSEPKTTDVPVVAPNTPNSMRIWKIAIEKIAPNPKQPRRTFPQEALQELASSIREKGIIQPILVRQKAGGHFEIIAGERRWRAAQLAGLQEVPAIIKESEDQEVLELALIENIQRENLNVIEEAEAYDFLIKKYNLTQHDLAQKMGKDRATIANVLRLLQLQPSVRQLVSSNQLSLGQAKVLLSISDGKLQESLARKSSEEKLSVRALEKLVAKSRLSVHLTPSDDGGDEQLRASMAKHLGEELQKLLGSKVILDYAQGKGRIQIQFYSDAELNQIADRLRGTWEARS
jgi:ParB family chromosome partitioning protein